MDQKTRSIIIGAVALLIIAVILGVVIYVARVNRTRNNVSGGDVNNPLTQLPTLPVTESGTSSGSRQPSLFKTFVGSGFSISYPQTWGLLTCSNSQNIEFDPKNSTDIRSVACDVAVKPVTILVVNQLNCPGQTVKIGDNNVIRSKVSSDNTSVDYRWCLKVGNKNLDITHRVSSSGSRATSKEDFSSTVEQIISTIKPTTSGS